MLISKIEQQLKTICSGSGYCSGSNWTDVAFQNGVNDSDLVPPVVIFYAQKGNEEIIGSGCYNVSANIQVQTPFADGSAKHIARCRGIEDVLNSYISTGSKGYAPLANALTTGSLVVFGVLMDEISESTNDDKFIYNVSMNVYAALSGSL